MPIETVSDAVATTRLLYKGREEHLLTKLEWWCKQLTSTKLLREVTTDDIDQGIQVLMSSPAEGYKRGVGVVAVRPRRSNGTVNKYIAALATMYKLLRQHRFLPRSFTSPLTPDLKLPESPGRTLQVSLDDVHALVAAARLTRNKKFPAIVAVACTTGLRRSNIQGLCWGDVDLKNRTIDVARTKNGTPMRSVVPIWVANELARIRPANPDKTLPVFGRHAFKRAWQSTIEKAEIPGSENWTFHHTRHIAASILTQSGASLPMVMACLNHKTPSMALRYTHLNTKTLDEAITKAWN